MNYLLPERLDRLAREYALGTLSGGARRRFERVLAQAPAAGRAVAAWQERFTVLSAGLPPMPPRPGVWRGLEQRLFAAPAKREGWWRALGGALGGVLAGVLLCAVLLRLQPGLMGLEPQVDSLPASYVGLLTDVEGKPSVLASSRRHGKQLTVKLLQPLTVPPGRVAQLWALPSDGSPAFPVGVVPARGTATLTLSDSSEKLFSKVSRLAVSLETTPAKPGDPPTLPFVLSGHCVKLW